MSTATLNRPAVQHGGTAASEPQALPEPTGEARLIDAFVAEPDVSDSHVRVVAASPGSVWGVLSRRSPADSASRIASALGISKRLSLPPTALASREGCEVVFALAWRFDAGAGTVDANTIASLAEPGHVRVFWSIEVKPIETGSLLSLCVRFAATDEVSRARLLAAWRLVGSASASVAQSALGALKAEAEEDHDESGS